jgi:hypothetical protein
MLIAGATGQGKTVCMNSILAGLLMTRTPEELRLILIDPKIVEFSGYNGLPHLLVPVITDAKKVISGPALAIQEMENRFKLFHRAGSATSRLQQPAQGRADGAVRRRGRWGRRRSRRSRTRRRCRTACRTG